MHFILMCNRQRGQLIKSTTSQPQKWGIKFQTILIRHDPDSLNSFFVFTVNLQRFWLLGGRVILFASPRLSEDCEQKVRAMEALDICSAKFSFSRAVEAVKTERARMLCDVLLDQNVLPGVGNIIKNEALFDSGLNPAVKVHFALRNTITKTVSLSEGCYSSINVFKIIL